MEQGPPLTSQKAQLGKPVGRGGPDPAWDG